ncbi:S-adenosyl-L-methionine-dependent methyltransferase [Obelidium mucronatum]|nr:S-adenosyl-L-methionine-dependent methyltransferase [Obelidium mucronatum]
MGDSAIRGTNDDATGARLSAVAAGYFGDPFAPLFARGGAGRLARKPPIINRGSYARFSALHALVTAFVASSEKPGSDRQIVVLGAGFDTRFFMLKSAAIHPKKYFEIDFPEITAKKAQFIKKNKDLCSLLGDHSLAAGGSEIHGSDYSLISGDLRKWHEEIVPKLVNAGYDSSIPTLFLAECVLVYMPPESIKTVVDWCAQGPTTSIMINYEQINPDDAFGKMMLENLKLRNIYLPGLIACPTLEAHKTRFHESGFTGATDAITMWDYYEHYLSTEEHARIAKLEIFDELEEWKLMGEHYCVSWGWQTRSETDVAWLREMRLSRK